MKTGIKSRAWFIILALPLVFLLPLITPQNENNRVQHFTLLAPSFINTAHAASENAALDTILNEAGISAYFNAGVPVSISSVRSAFTTIELETNDYILGSVALANYNEVESPHVYVHKDGWFLAYYLNMDPAAKIIDWVAYTNSGDTVLSTKLENVLSNVAGLAGVGATGITHYDFRYPNAVTMMLIAERDQGDGNDFFTIEIPASFGVSERSWSIYGSNNFIHLDGTRLNTNAGHQYNTLTALQLTPDTTHTVTILYGSDDVGGLAILYRE